MRTPKHTPNAARIEGDVAHLTLTDMRGEPVCEAMIDLADLEFVQSIGRWCPRYDKHTKSYYVVSSATKKTLHRTLMSPPRALVVDHHNHDTLDNRRANLVVCTNGQNARNRRTSLLTPSGVRGVTWAKDKQRWRAQITALGFLHLGYFQTKEEAVLAVQVATHVADTVRRRSGLT